MPDLACALRAVLPPGVALGQGQIAPLWPGEAVPGAVPARLAEFARGRSAARDAMRVLGVAGAAVPMRPDRSPDWPVGLTGSISHCEGACLAILGLRAEFAGLGLDIEPKRGLDSDLWPVILRPEECDGLSDPLLALAIFVAKEAAYKAQYAVTGQVFDFHTLSVVITADRFAAIYQRQVGGFAKGCALHGRLVQTARHIAAVCAVTAS